MDRLVALERHELMINSHRVTILSLSLITKDKSSLLEAQGSFFFILQAKRRKKPRVEIKRGLTPRVIFFSAGHGSDEVFFHVFIIHV